MGAAVVVTACASGARPEPSEPTHLTWIACPSDVEIQFVSRHECGELTVPQDHARPDGPTISLLVLKVWPVGIEPGSGLVTGIGANPGDAGPLGGDLAAGATRAGVIGVNLAPRGSTSHAGASLACPEVRKLSTAGTEDRDPVARSAFVDAVGACVSRLRTDGVEPAAFDASATAQDLEALRRALGEESWAAAGSYGAMSRAALAYLARAPGRIDRLVLDSPASGELDPLTAGVVGLDSALAELAKEQPGLRAAWQRALTTVGRAPLRGTSQGTPVVVDAAKLVRLIRAALGGDGPQHVKAVPGMITAAARGRLNRDLAALAAAEPPFCSGYIPLCRAYDDFALGLFLTDFCEQLPADRTALDAAIAGRPAYQQAFGASPYQDACKAWGVDPVPAIAAGASSAPTLLLSGGLDSFSRPEWSKQLATRLGPDAWSVTIPGHTHNVLGSSPCAIALRDAWRAKPPAAPERVCT